MWYVVPLPVLGNTNLGSGKDSPLTNIELLLSLLTKISISFGSIICILILWASNVSTNLPVSYELWNFYIFIKYER